MLQTVVCSISGTVSDGGMNIAEIGRNKQAHGTAKLWHGSCNTCRSISTAV
jgi:hypothetical protein